MGHLRKQIPRYRQDKEKRYEKFEILLDSALRAGAEAASRVPEHTGQQARRGAVRVRLEDGRTSFARFIREKHPDEWKRGNRRVGNYLPVGFLDYDRSLAYADAVAEVLTGGGVDVSVDTQYVAGPEDGPGR